MKVNVKKSEIMVFRTSKMRLPMVRWYYGGVEMRIVESAEYLGYPMQAVGNQKPWVGKLKDAGLKASYVLQGVVKKHDLYAPEMQVRLFNTFVLPAMSYACQMWGADCSMFKSAESALDNDLQRIHLRFLRFVSGAANHVPNVVLLHEFKAVPVVCHWLRLVLRFWNKMVLSKNALLRAVFKANVQLALLGLKDCWSAKVLGMLVVFREMSSVGSLRHEDICNMVLDVDRVVDILYSQVMQSLTSVHINPRLSPSPGAQQCTYLRWFAHADRFEFHPHVKCTSIFAGLHRELMRFRLGCAKNAVNSGRFLAPNVKQPRAQRSCPCCSSGQAEDELHMVFECDAYQEIRSRSYFAVLFSIGDGHDMNSLFCSPIHQPLLADFIRAISLKRAKLVDTVVRV